jgi:N-acetylglucosaminyl-diphospho-decaprenol L-rhamnosyltransferase
MARRTDPAYPLPSGRITISIVSHRHGSYVRELLADLDAVADRIDRVIVTRNVPEDDGFAELRPAFPMEIVENAQPRGFAANHNAAFALCASPWFLVLNPDVRLDASVIANLVDHAPRGSGVLSPRVMEPGKTEPEPRRSLLTPFEIMGRWVHPEYDAPRAEWVAGVFMLFRSAAFRAVRGFDEKFFMYVEDADICARLKLSGWAVTVDESLRILHDAQRDSDRNWRALGWHWASMFKWWFSAPLWRLLVARVLPATVPGQAADAASSQTARPK